MKLCIDGYRRVKESEAKKLHEKGEKVHFLPSLANLFNPRTKLGSFPKEGRFEDILNWILIYQPKELGRRVNFYVSR